MGSCLNQRWTCRILWNSENLLNTSVRASRTRRSGSLSIRSWRTFYIADRHREKKLAPASLLLERFQRALTQDRQFHLAHGALHAEQQPVIGMTGIVNPLFVQDDRADQTAGLDQSVPSAALTL